MTSPASSQNVPAPSATAPPATASYASAAGASGKVAATPVIASGSAPIVSSPVVVGSAAAAAAPVVPAVPSAHNGNVPAVSSPLNGSDTKNKPAKPSTTSGTMSGASNTAPAAAKPIVPAVPAVINGSNAKDHARKSSVTISAVGPSGHPAGRGLKFGFESPATTQSTLQATAAPIPIPNAGNPRIASPAHSPSPIPQPSASGGRPPSISQEGTTMKFGSLGDGDRPIRNTPNMPANNLYPAGSQSPHFRRGSTHSAHSDIGNNHAPSNGAGAHNHNGPNHGNHGHHGGPGGPGRGGYGPQGGRGRGYNHQYNNQAMGFSPGGGYRGPTGQGRGGMPSQFQPRAPNFGPNMPQGSRVSPAIAPAIPNNGTPPMPPVVPASQAMNPQYLGYSQFPAGFPPQVNNYPPYGQQFNPQGVMGYPAYGQMNPYSGPPKGQSQVFVPAYGGPHFAPPAPAMSRNSSQAASERPGSSTGPAATPVVPALATASPATGSVSGGSKISATAPSFQIPRKKAAIVIKNPQGETLDFNNIKAPATPSPSTPDVSRTPPVTAPAAATPPPKSSTPAPHARAESTTAAKTTEQLRMEFQEKVHKTASAPVDSADKAKTEAPAEEKAAPAAPSAAVEAKPAPAEAKPAPAEAKPAAVVVSKPAAEPAEAAKPAEEAKAAEAPKAAEVAKVEAPSAAPAADDEDEMERMIREMEEIEAKRDAEEAAYAEEKKKKAEAERLANAPENDRKLREQEREMERLEEERKRQREANEAAAAAGGQTTSVADMLAARISDITLSERKETTADALASKLGDMKLGDSARSSASPTSESATVAGKQQRAKPSALNLAPLNTKAIEPAQPSAALQSLKTAHFLRDPMSIKYPKGIMSPNPALNPAVNKKGNFKYDMGFLLQFKDVFVEKPSLDFDQQVKQLIGDGESASRSGTRTPASSSSSRQNTRGGNPGFSTMGAMGSFNSKPLPSGTTSEQRFAMSSGAMPRSTGLPQYNRPAAFPGPSPMARTPSSSLGGPMPNSPRQGSRSARGNSRRDANPKDAKTMPLTAGVEVRPITVSASGWKPTSIGNRSVSAAQAPANGAFDPQMVQRKVKAALNKMTPENFDRISDQILTIALQSKDEEDGRTLRQVIQLTFEKATDEAHWASMYARFCKRMLDMMSPEIRDVTIKDKKGDVISGGTLFRKYLLNRCQEEFERGWKTDLPQPKEGETKEMVMLSDEYYLAAAAKRRGLGLVQFIGELYKLGMLTERIMHECVRKLVDYESVPDEAEIESLSKLLQTVGANLDNTEKGRPMMDAYFVRIRNMIEIPELASRLKFMLMDVVDLRSRHWVSNEVNKGPKTLEEVRLEAEAAAAQKAAEAARTSQRGGGGRGGMGGRDSRQFQHNQPIPNQVGMDDLRRLKGSASRIASSSMGPLGPTSLFASRSNSGRRNGPGGSFGRPGDDSNPASRTGTPPTRADTNSVSHSNAFEALANVVDTETPASPPSTAVSPAMAKSNLDKATSK